MSEKMLVKKLAKVMQEVKYIEKKGHNKFHNYKYATESDVAEKVREVLAEQNVMMIPNMKEHSVRTHETAKGKTEYIATVLMEFTFMDGDTGEHFSFCMAGEGQDAGDKSYYKAITGAQKYALMKAFMIPTGDDPEGDTGVDERNQNENTSGHSTGKQMEDLASDKQLNLVDKLIKEVAEKHNITVEESYNTLRARLGTQLNLEEFTKKLASQAITILNEAKTRDLKQGA